MRSGYYSLKNPVVANSFKHRRNQSFYLRYIPPGCDPEPSPGYIPPGCDPEPSPGYIPPGCDPEPSPGCIPPGCDPEGPSPGCIPNNNGIN
uniref:Candidate secreted effector n=1 Tax=Meloidogyne incognita TaxID=6306 RepID=A0A914L4C9_MELIC